MSLIKEANTIPKIKSVLLHLEERIKFLENLSDNKYSIGAETPQDSVLTKNSFNSSSSNSTMSSLTNNNSYQDIDIINSPDLSSMDSSINLNAETPSLKKNKKTQKKNRKKKKKEKKNQTVRGIKI